MTSISDDYVKYLKKSPVFAGSLGSKELFHSNLWAYLIEQKQEFMNAFFGDKFKPGVDQIVEDKQTGEFARREKLNMDLLVVTKDKVFVIENKIKSLPRIEQLKQYEESINNHFPHIKEKHFLLTGIRKEKPSHLAGLDEWKYKSYREISNGIRKELKFCEKENYYSYANEYCDVIVKLSELMKLGVDGIKNKFFFAQFIDKKTIYPNSDLLKEITRLRLGDIFQKLNADSFAKKVREEIARKGLCLSLSGLICNSGFTHGNSLAEFFFEEKKVLNKENKSKKKKTEYVRIGVQIQGTQFRWYIEAKKEKRVPEDVIYNKGIKLNWFFEKKENKIEYPTLEEHETPMTKSYCLFKTTNDMFVYQYHNIGEDGCDFGTLSDEVISFLMIAKTKVLDIKKEFLT